MPPTNRIEEKIGKRISTIKFKKFRNTIANNFKKYSAFVRRSLFCLLSDAALYTSRHLTETGSLHKAERVGSLARVDVEDEILHSTDEYDEDLPHNKYIMEVDVSS